MQLTDFLYGLVNEGKVIVAGKITPFNDTDNEVAVLFLRQYYNKDVIEIPYIAPSFDEEAALWGVQYIYLCTQLTVLRELEEADVTQYLKPYDGDLTAEVIYSVDLALRFLPQLYTLAKGLAPADILVSMMLKTASNWPFSSVGIEIQEAHNTEPIFQHPALKYCYIDRIIAQKDLKRALLSEEVKNTVIEVLSTHAQTLWPQFVEE
ncbi:MAG: hypothetical protein ACO1PI_10525 [Bacteroidota bacterium]